MNELLKTKFFVLMNEDLYTITNEEMQNAYGCFMKEVRTVSQSEKNYSEIFRTLSITRIELVSIESGYRYGQGEKCA